MRATLILIVVGAALMSGCGTLLAHALGPGRANALLLLGFAIGVVLLGQAPALDLRRRVAQLERRAREA